MMKIFAKSAVLMLNVNKGDIMKNKKIFSGDFKYVCRVSRNFAALGWRIVKQKRWGDGKWTFVMEYADV